MRLLLIVCLLLVAVPLAAEETVEVPVSKLEEWRDHIRSLQDQVDTLTETVIELELENDQLRRESTGFYAGVGAGLPFPSVSAYGLYRFRRFGVLLSAHYLDNPLIQAGIVVRVGK
jgi:hypothetical protein